MALLVHVAAFRGRTYSFDLSSDFLLVGLFLVWIATGILVNSSCLIQNLPIDASHLFLLCDRSEDFLHECIRRDATQSPTGIKLGRRMPCDYLFFLLSLFH